MAKETWKSIKGYEKLYEISSFGRVKSLKRIGNNRERIMKPWKGQYLSCGMSKNGVLINHTIHRLVAENFLKNPKGYMFVNHKNGKKYDNRLKNLEWVDARQNALHAYFKGLKSVKGEKNSHHKLTLREVKFIRWIKLHYPNVSPTIVGKFYKMSATAFSDIWNFRNWTDPKIKRLVGLKNGTRKLRQG